MAHGKYSPSKAHRWLVCHGSVDFPETDGTSIYAEDGSLGHDVLEAILKGQIVLTGDLVNGKPAPEHRIQQAIEIRDWVSQWKQQHPDWVTESEVPLSIGLPLGIPVELAEEFDGTADIVSYNLKELLVTDAKFGFVRVEPKNNPQLYLYAMGALWDIQTTYGTDVSKMSITVMIAQPNYEGIVEFREHRMPFSELRDWYVKIKPSVTALLDDDRTYYAGDESACRWCPGRAICLERQAKLREFASEEWRMTKTLGELLPLLPQIRHICDDLEKEAVKQLAEGMTVPGFKLVESRSIRKWSSNHDVIGAAEQLGWKADKFAPHKLLSPAQMEKAYGAEGKEFTKLLAYTPKGGPKLVPESDPRPEYKPDTFTQEEIDSLLKEE